jgi:hypothetical protein
MAELMASAPDPRLHIEPELSREALVLRYGHEYRGSRWDSWKGRGYRKRRTKECFANAADYSARYSDLTYVEGFAALRQGRPVHHAWCITPDSGVVDPTWSTDADESTEYFGIPFPPQLSARISLARHGNHLSALSVDADLRAELSHRFAS